MSDARLRGVVERLRNGGSVRIPSLPLAVLLIVDSTLIAADVGARDGWIHDRRFLLTTEWGYGEMAQYLKFTLLSVAAAFMAVRWKSVVALGWAAFFTVLLCDDAFQIHERTGLALEALDVLPAAGNLRPRDVGELLFAAVLGFGACGLAVFGLRRGTARDAVFTSVALAGVLVLAFFGVGVDVLHTLARGTALQNVAAVVEDGGELIATSLLAAAVMGLLLPRPVALKATRRGEPVA